MTRLDEKSDALDEEIQRLRRMRHGLGPRQKTPEPPKRD
jgi:hypothetical protein